MKEYNTEANFRAIFLLSFIEILGSWQLENGYWPNHEHYDQIRRDNPWFLFKTHAGMIKIGWRKRVISIDWSDTNIKKIVTEDNVTKDETSVHAWSHFKAVQYLTELGREIKAPIVLENPT